MPSLEPHTGQGQHPVYREYHRLAPSYDWRWRSYIDATLDFVSDALPLEGNERILDVPCGPDWKPADCQTDSKRG